MSTLPLVVGLGGGGHAKVMIEALRAGGAWEIVGLLTGDPTRTGERVLGLPILGGDTLLPELHRQGVRHFFVGLGTVGDGRGRRRLYETALGHGLEPVEVVHPRAFVSPSARLGRGTCVLAGAIVGTEARVGENVIINTGAIVEHDCVVGDHVHVATGACLAGSVHVGNESLVGLGASIRQGIRVGARSVVGAGAVVVSPVPDRTVVAGVPARIIGEPGE